MTQIIHFEPLTEETFDTYIKVGTKAYNQHYRHLWPNGDTYPYIQTSFTHAVLAEEQHNHNTQLFLIKQQTQCVGILKLTTDCALDGYSEEEALYLDKIYIIKEASGKGIGTKTLQFVHLRAKAKNKILVWLAAMQKGPALHFYQKNGYSIHGKTEIRFKQALEAEKPMFILKQKIN
jgi:GNAT superfamily N-acetyltransferase